MEHIDKTFMKASSSARTGSSTKRELKRRILVLAELRGATVPSGDALEAYISAVSGFSEAVVDQACRKLERATRGDFEPAMPTLAMLEACCRAETQSKPQNWERGVWQCESCKTQVASYRTPRSGCQSCGHLVLVQRLAPGPAFDRDAYMADVRAHPENYVSVADLIREVMDRRRRAGKPVWNFADPRQGESA